MLSNINRIQFKYVYPDFKLLCLLGGNKSNSKREAIAKMRINFIFSEYRAIYL